MTATRCGRRAAAFAAEIAAVAAESFTAACRKSRRLCMTVLSLSGGGGVHTRRRNGRAMNGSVRKKLPFPVSFRVYALEPNGVQLPRRGVSILRHEQADITPVGDHDIAMHFGFDAVEIVNQVLPAGNAFQER